MDNILPGRNALSALPEEILEIIAEYAAEHVLGLRQTCREIQHKSWRTFARRFFSARHIWIDKDSLATLQKIASEERFASCLKRLTVHLHEWDVDEIKSSFGDEERLFAGKSRAYDYAHAQVNEQQFLLQSGQAVLQLSSILRSLSNLEHFTLTGQQDPNELWPFTHFKPVQPPGLITDSNNHGNYTTSVWLAIVQSLLQSGVKLHELSVTAPIPRHGITHMIPSVLHSLSSVFESLATLELSVKIPSMQPQRRFWQSSFAAFLGLCLNVSKLDAQFETQEDENGGSHYGSDPILESLATWPTFPNLTRLCLSVIEVKPHHLLEFLERHQETLKHLVLDSPWFGVEPGGWRIVLEGLAVRFNLDRLQFSVYEQGDEFDLVHADGLKIIEAIDKALETGLVKPRPLVSPVPSDASDHEVDSYEEDDSYQGYPALRAMYDDEDDFWFPFSDEPSYYFQW